MAMSIRGTRLGLASLGGLPAAARPAVRPDRVRPGVLHLGLGAFHRAHQAVYTHDAMAAAGGDWGIVGVAPRSRGVLDRLIEQDGLFSVVTLAEGRTDARVIGALAELRHAASDPEAVVARIADPAIRVVTLTVTEKAYGLDPATGRLRVDDALRAELTGARPPTGIPALLVRGLATRALTDAAPLAVVSCDNLPDNGRRLGGMVTQALHAAVAAGHPGAVPERVLDWAAAHVTFPCTMVDRIVPATTDQTLAAARAALGVDDLAAVAAEPFSQWVVQDDFPAGRPAWDAAGAVFTADVGPYERLKLRCLNGVHSTVAYLGALAGCETVADALRLPGLPAVLERLLVEDIAPTIAPPPGVDVAGYGRTVLTRFANPAIRHRTLQIAVDGSQKLPQRLLHTIAERRAAGAQPRWAALALAGWVRFVGRRADDGRPLPLDDPLASRIDAALAAVPDTPAGRVGALFGLSEVFEPALAADDTLRGLVTDWLSALAADGVAATLARVGGAS